MPLPRGSRTVTRNAFMSRLRQRTGTGCAGPISHTAHGGAARRRSRPLSSRGMRAFPHSILQVHARSACSWSLCRRLPFRYDRRAACRPRTALLHGARRASCDLLALVHAGVLNAASLGLAYASHSTSDFPFPLRALLAGPPLTGATLLAASTLTSPRDPLVRHCCDSALTYHAPVAG
jgi:hypothetical protein